MMDYNRGMRPGVNPYIAQSRTQKDSLQHKEREGAKDAK